MSNQRGFIGLLGLLIVVMTIAFLAVKVLTKIYQPSGPETDGFNNSNSIPSILDQAKDAKREIENRNRGE
ncbi:MAG: hypothetical protein AAB677_02990 [Patescibacteria group bacterium]